MVTINGVSVDKNNPESDPYDEYETHTVFYLDFTTEEDKYLICDIQFDGRA